MALHFSKLYSEIFFSFTKQRSAVSIKLHTGGVFMNGNITGAVRESWFWQVKYVLYCNRTIEITVERKADYTNMTIEWRKYTMTVKLEATQRLSCRKVRGSWTPQPDEDRSVNFSLVKSPSHRHQLHKIQRRQSWPEESAQAVSGHPSLLCVLNSIWPQQQRRSGSGVATGSLLTELENSLLL